MSENRRHWKNDPRISAPEQRKTPAEVLELLTASAGEAFLEGRVAEWVEGASTSADPYRQVWLKIHRDALHAVVKRLFGIQFPHFVVIAAEDRGETIELPYIFRLYHGAWHEEILVVITAVVPKSDPVVDTLSDLIAGIVLSEREKQEMIGVVVRNIPDGRRMFLPEDFPQGVYPWRRDETGVADTMVRHLWATGREAFNAREAEKAAAAAEMASAAAPPASAEEGGNP
ncbi:MAG: NADH-quinone oxidoreductase subunit C [Verrucomicrobiota bacterium]|jgi:membrane-bound hydrogenase subunit beta|nr:NADH-quinone oxidoreductase subunit C [Verrucomicrobiota bacterium]